MKLVREPEKVIRTNEAIKQSPSAPTQKVLKKVLLLWFKLPLNNPKSAAENVEITIPNMLEFSKTPAYGKNNGYLNNETMI